MRKWTYLDVVTDMHREDVYALTLELSSEKPGSPLFLAAYRAALTQFEKTLDDDQRRTYKAMAKDWTEKMPPSGMQRRYVHINHSSRL